MLPAKQVVMLIEELTYAELVVIRDIMFNKMIMIQNKLQSDLKELE